MEREEELLQRGTIDVSVGAGEEKYVELPLNDYSNEKEVIVTVSALLKNDEFFAEAGYEVAFGQKVLRGNVKYENKKKSKLKVVHGDVNIGVHGEDFKVIFSKQEGGIVSLRYAEKEFITRVPKPYYWRATTDNDRGNKHEFRCIQWMSATVGQKYCDFSLDEKEDSISLKYT